MHTHGRRRRTKRRTAPGSMPGTVAIDPNAPKPQIHLIAFTADHYVEKEIEDLAEIEPARQAHPFVWLQVEGLGDDRMLLALRDMFKLHRLAMEDVVNVHQRPKIEEYADSLYIVMRLPVQSDSVHSEQLSLFIGGNFVITFEERDNDALEPVKERLRKKIGLIRGLGVDFLAYAIIDAVIDRYFPILETIGDQIEAVETQMLESPRRELINRVYCLKQDLLALRRCVWPSRDALNSLVRDPFPQLGAETRVYMRDVYDHIIQIMDHVETDRELVSDLRDLYLTNLSNRANEIMKVLTLLGSIFLPMNFIAALYGMNFNTDSPYNMPELNWRLGYPFALTIMLSISISMLIFFWRKGWIWRRD